MGTKKLVQISTDEPNTGIKVMGALVSAAKECALDTISLETASSALVRVIVGARDGDFCLYCDNQDSGALWVRRSDSGVLLRLRDLFVNILRGRYVSGVNTSDYFFAADGTTIVILDYKEQANG